jgi:hypothetical protein
MPGPSGKSVKQTLLLEQKGNGTTAGLGYLEVCVDCPRIVPPFGGFRLSTPSDESHKSSADFNLNRKHNVKIMCSFQ